jgi:hypothetical protein
LTLIVRAARQLIDEEQRADRVDIGSLLMTDRDRDESTNEAPQ